MRHRIAPARPLSPDGRRIDVAVSRVRSRGRARAQLWYFAGGPGGAGTALLPLVVGNLTSRVDGIDVYAVDHRGTGGSGRLSCPDQEAPGSPAGGGIAPEELGTCLERLVRERRDELPFLTVTASARDVHAIMSAVRGPGPVLVWGNSYGTYWAHRLLQLFPDAVDGAFLEALVPPDASYQGFDFWMNDAGRRLMARCAADPDCRRRFSRDPMTVVDGLAARLAAGHCAAVRFPIPISWVLGSLLYDHGLSGMIPLIIHLLDRCSDRDVASLRQLYDTLFGARGTLFPVDFSAPLYAHVVLSEMFDPSLPSGQTLDGVVRTCLFCPADRAAMARARPRWPTYLADLRRGRVADYRGSMWMLQGGLDPAIPPRAAAQMADMFDGPHQHYIAFPDSAHSLVGDTPTDDGDCALSILVAFVTDHRATPPVACVGRVQSPPFPAGPPGMAARLLGTADPW